MPADADRHAPAHALRTALIVGAGQAGQLLARDLQGGESRITPIGFVDDASNRIGSIVAGLPVLGTTQHLPELVRRYRADEILIAIPSATGAQIRRITELCLESGIPFRTAPSVADLPECRLSLRQIREVRIDDLLGRDPVHISRREIDANLHGQVVLVTGAGGSIGSELARQIALATPARLVLFERSESDLYQVEHEVRRRTSAVQVEAIVGDMLDVDEVREAFALHHPTRVFHAAAYKHVPMMETHVVAAARNNVVGTANVLEAARAFGAEQFVLLSTDKAVRPTSVMGATKRAAERLVLSGAGAPPKACAVRFGNVLGSRGSVVPLFQGQIAAGGPVTVTHPDVVRYFMTVHEAVQLVMQASAMAVGGEVFLLDMGELVRIADLADQLIRLSGKEPGVDVRVEFVGLRPGEKLVEEPLTDPRDAEPTGHSRIKVARGVNGGSLPDAWLAAMRGAVQRRSAAEVVDLLRQAVPDYAPGRDVRETLDRTGARR